MSQPLFYVKLRDNFRDKIRETREPGFFQDFINPYKEAAGRLQMERVYPVVEVPSTQDIIVLDDQGLPFRTSNHLFKFTEH